MIVIKKNVSIENVLDAGHLKSNTDLPSESWPLEVLATQLARAIKNINLQFISCTHMHKLH